MKVSTQDKELIVQETINDDKGVKNKQASSISNDADASGIGIMSSKVPNKAISYYSCLTSNYGLKESSTQTDLCFGDLSRYDDILLALRGFLSQNSLGVKNPFGDINLLNSSLFKNIRINKENLTKRKTVKSPLGGGLSSDIIAEPKIIQEKKRIKKKTIKGDIKIFNSVVVNNNTDSNFDKQYYKSLLGKESSIMNADLTENYNQIFNYLSNSKGKKTYMDATEENSGNESSDISQLLNQIRGKDERIESARLKQNGIGTSGIGGNPSQIKSSIISSASLGKEKKDNSKPHIHLRHQQTKIKKERKPRSKSKKRISEEKSDNDNALVLNEANSVEKKKSITKTELSYSNSQSQNKILKKKYDPFTFFMDEFKQNNPAMIEQQIEKEAKEQWLKLDKDTRKIYNIHADREKKLQKQKKRQKPSQSSVADIHEIDYN